MDAIAVLKRDHEEVERLFRQFEKLTERAHRSKQKIVMKIIRELAIHAAVEEMLFYPAVRTAALKANVRALKEPAGPGRAAREPGSGDGGGRDGSGQGHGARRRGATLAPGGSRRERLIRRAS